MSDAFGVCGVCCREIPVKNDGRLRAHLAASSAPGHREQCDGSGSPSARLDLAPGSAGYERGQPLMSRPAAFNAREEWLKADALYAEFEDMMELGAANYETLVSARDAVNRALADARALAPWWLASAYTDGGETP